MRSERQQQESSANATDDATNVPRGGGTGPWRGNVLYMRIIMCQTEDALKSLFLAQANTLLQAELDARNSSCRPQNVFEPIAELWNSSAFDPLAPLLACHEDFMTSIDCRHDLVVHLDPATPQRIQDVLPRRARTSYELYLTGWEISGQGDGGRENKDGSTVDKNGSSTSIEIEELAPTAMSGNHRNRPPRALDNRAAFLNGRPSYLLFFGK